MLLILFPGPVPPSASATTAKYIPLFGPQEEHLTVNYAIVNRVKALFKRFPRAPSNEEFRKQKYISFDEEQDGVLGIVGQNCAGKSMLQKDCVVYY